MKLKTIVKLINYFGSEPMFYFLLGLCLLVGVFL